MTVEYFHLLSDSLIYAVINMRLVLISERVNIINAIYSEYAKKHEAWKMK